MKLFKIKMIAIVFFFPFLMVAKPLPKKPAKTKKLNPLKMEKPSGYNEDEFYRTYFSKVDAGIENEYQNKWRFHNLQTRYSPGSQKDEHYTMGTVESYGQGRRESEVRSEFAEQVLRMRVDSAFRTYFAGKENSFAKKALDTMERIKDMRVQTGVAGQSGQQAEVCFGYDVLTDSSKIEYIKGKIEAGLYHPKLTGAFMGRSQMTDANFSVWTNMDGTIPRTRLSVPANADTFSTSLSQPLAKNLMGTIGTSQPLKNRPANSSYDITFSLDF